MLVFPCSNCGAKLQMADDLAGKKVRCAGCQSVVTAPNVSQAIQSETAAPSKSRSSAAVKSGTASRARGDDDDRPRRSSDGDAATTAAAATAAGLGIGAIMAIVLGIAAVLGCCIVGGVGVALIIPGVQKVREAAARAQTQNNMKQIVLAEHSHNDAFRALASPKMLNPQKNNQPVELSWRVSLLPFIEQGPLFNRFDKTSAWDSPANRSLMNPMPMVYADVLHDGDKVGGTDTRFQYFTGPGTVWPTPTAKRVIPNDFITGGTSNTILFAESTNPVPWSKPADMAVQANQPLPLPPDRFFAAFADGSVRMIDHRRIPDATILLYLDPQCKVAHPPLE